MSQLTNKVGEGHFVNIKIMSIFTDVVECRITKENAMFQLNNLSKTFNFNTIYTEQLKNVIDEFYDNELN